MRIMSGRRHKLISPAGPIAGLLPLTMSASGDLGAGSYEVTSTDIIRTTPAGPKSARRHSQLIHRAQASQKHAAYEGPLHSKTR